MGLGRDYKQLPKSPGVYLFKDKHNKLLYIGKAKSLRNRVASYFLQDHRQSPRIRVMAHKIADIDYYLLDSEVEALLLENKLIKQYKPRYNIELRDDKTYAYIKITDEEYPRIMTTRRVTKSGEYFGPFADGTLRNHLFRLCIRLFKLITRQTFTNRSQLNYEIGLSPAPSMDEINKEEYLKQVEEAKAFLRGENVTKIRKRLVQEMKRAASEMKFEIAKEKKQDIEAIDFLKERQKVDLMKPYDQHIIAILHDHSTHTSLITIMQVSKGVISGKQEYRLDHEEELLGNFIKMYYSSHPVPKEILVNEEFWDEETPKETYESYLRQLRGGAVTLRYPQRGEKRRLVELAEKNAEANFGSQDVLEVMKRNLELPSIPHVIECFDMSNLGREHLVGGMTRWVDGQPDKEQYRRFQIKGFKGKNDDTTAMREVVYRRYYRLKEQEGPYPDLILIDGGKGQLNAARQALAVLGLSIPLRSLAKKEEEIFIPGRSEPLQFSKDSPMMLLLRRIRDSVHTYVLAYNKKKRQMQFKEDIKEG